MSIYTTPLQFGYFFSLILSLLFFYRGFKEERLSDKMLGFLMFLMAQTLQDYTFGFSGINFLWNELNGFPRGIALLLAPSIYFYLRSQVNRNFKLQWKDIIHLLPWFTFFVYYLIFFLQGPEAVQRSREYAINEVLIYVDTFILWIGYVYYFTKSVRLYNQYRKWSKEQFSDTETISFKWFRNFLYLMISWAICKEVMAVIDWIIDLDFYQDWWWNLPVAATAFYVGLAGYAQRQPSRISFQLEDEHATDSALPEQEMPGEKQSTPMVDEKETDAADYEKTALAEKLKALMQSDRLYLQPELSLSELAAHLKTNTSLLSSTINQVFDQNFNDYINGLRIGEFIDNYQKEENQAYTLLSIAYESGFNSKATFNRAFKKHKGVSPKMYFAEVA